MIYPTLSWLKDMGYVALDTEEAGRKRYSITSEGEAFLVANRAAADELLARGSSPQAEAPNRVPMPVGRAMEFEDGDAAAPATGADRSGGGRDDRHRAG